MKEYFKLLLLFILILTFTVGCNINSGGDSVETSSEESTEGTETEAETDTEAGGEGEETNGIDYTYDSSITGEITFWSWDEMFKDVIKEFNKVYPNVKVELVNMELGELHDNLQTTINAGEGAPDVSHVEQFQIPRFQSEGLLVDVSQPPYNASRFRDLFSEYNWTRWQSIDGKRQLALPWDVVPGVFYYRTDIYEQMGFPTDPQELGEFLQDPENVLTVAQTFSANGIYMYEFRDSPAIQYGDAVGYFDSEYNYLRNDERMAELLDTVKQGVQLNWAPQMSILFSDEGKQLVNQGKVASFPAGNNAARHLADIFPDQSGKWSVTRMPLGVNVALGGSTFVIPEQSENKEAAWAFIEYLTLSEEAWKIYVEKAVQPGVSHITSLPWFQEHTNEYLGGIQDYKFYDTLDEAIPVRKFTPLDGAAWDIYIEKINEAIDKNIDSKTILQQIEDNTLKQLGPEIEKQLTEMNGS
ncbi:ABC transporter substrate-binding protein [Gracilibacillus sp. D59]|uniref:ABC transporter substrate-binding protein n=1 Tax=Gracilibacillus sp. D59 TaxID=3457434 RepID=UPI003FCD485B